jgi:Predicted transcriptional regulators
MVKRGLGDTQLNAFKTAKNKILEVLKDGEWYRYSELTEKTRLSTATLSKHLKELEKGIVERRVGVENAEYPPPVNYRLKPVYTIREEKGKELHEYTLALNRDDRVKNPDLFLIYLNMMQTFAFIGLLKAQFWDPSESEESFNQALEYIILPLYRENFQFLRLKLKEQEDKGVDVEGVLNKTEANLSEFFEENIAKLFKRSKRSFGL